MILPIYIYGQPVLRKQAEDIDKDYEGLSALIENMFETMAESDGIANRQSHSIGSNRP